MKMKKSHNIPLIFTNWHRQLTFLLEKIVEFLCNALRIRYDVAPKLFVTKKLKCTLSGKIWTTLPCAHRSDLKHLSETTYIFYSACAPMMIEATEIHMIKLFIRWVPRLEWATYWLEYRMFHSSTTGLWPLLCAMIQINSSTVMMLDLEFLNT